MNGHPEDTEDGLPNVLYNIASSDMDMMGYKCRHKCRSTCSFTQVFLSFPRGRSGSKGFLD